LKCSVRLKQIVTDTPRRRVYASKKLRAALHQNADDVKKDIQYYMTVPSEDTHINHVIREPEVCIVSSLQARIGLSQLAALFQLCVRVNLPSSLLCLSPCPSPFFSFPLPFFCFFLPAAMQPLKPVRGSGRASREGYGMEPQPQLHFGELYVEWYQSIIYTLLHMYSFVKLSFAQRH